jgi:hypothetical protein
LSFSAAFLTVTTMSARKAGLSPWRSALRPSSDSWLAKFFTSCMTKAMRRLNSSNRLASSSASCPGMFGEVARELASHDAEEIEVLPIERAGMGRPRQHHHADQALEVEQGTSAQALASASSQSGAATSSPRTLRPCAARRDRR